MTEGGHLAPKSPSRQCRLRTSTASFTVVEDGNYTTTFELDYNDYDDYEVSAGDESEYEQRHGLPIL